MALTAFLVLCASVLLVVYPYAIYPLILTRLPRRVLAVDRVASPQSFALLFCAHNEERALPETLNGLRQVKARWPGLRILAYDDASSDRTGALLSEASDVLEWRSGLIRIGKPAGMRLLFDEAEADIVIFMDANVLIDPTSLRHFERYFDDPDVGAVAGTLHSINADESPVASVGSLYWRIEEKIKRLESETGSTMGADGSLFAIRSRLYPKVRSDLQDDFLASMSAVIAGYRCISAPDILAYERVAADGASEFRRKRRIACGAFSTHRYMWRSLGRLSGIDRFKYVSHKLVRWFGAAFIALGFGACAVLAAAFDLGFIYGVLLASGSAMAWLGLRLRIRPFGALAAVLSAMIATFIGIVESLVGRRYATWTPVDR